MTKAQNSFGELLKERNVFSETHLTEPIFTKILRYI